MAQKMDKGKLLKLGLKAFLLPEEREAKKGKAAAAAAGASQQSTPPAPKQPADDGASRQDTMSAPNQPAAGATAASCIYQYRSPAPLIYQVDPNIDAEEAMKLHDGVHYSQNKSTAMAY